MKRLILYTIVVCFMLSSCTQSSNNQSSESEVTIDFMEENPPDVPQSRLLIQDSTQYSKNFLELLVASNYAQTFELKDGFLIMDGRDTTSFPQDLILNKSYYFIGKKEAWTYELEIEAINYTTLKYHFQRFENKDLKEDLKGEADISAIFFLGDESDEDDKTGNTYFASEYIHDIGDCSFFIRIGRDEGDLKGKVVYYCEDGSVGIELEEGPTLREK